MGASNASSNGSNDTQVSGYEREINRQKAAEKAKKQAEANVEMGLGKSSTNVTDGTLSDPREKDDTGVKQSIKDSKKTTTTYGGGGNGGQGAGAESGNNTITQVTKTSPTEAEVSQATTAEADADTEANRLLKIKKRGRSMTMMSGAKGVTRTSSDYSLGKKSLLGMV